jgi:hypothetical protein
MSFHCEVDRNIARPTFLWTKQRQGTRRFKVCGSVEVNAEQVQAVEGAAPSVARASLQEYPRTPIVCRLKRLDHSETSRDGIEAQFAMAR